MAQTEWGSAGPVQTYGDAAYDPMQGWEQELRYRGYVDDIASLEATFITAGWQARTETTGSQWSTLIVRIPNSADSDYFDRWEFNITFKQQELLTNLGIYNYLTTAGLSNSQITDLGGQMTAALNANPPMTNGAFYTAQDTLYSDSTEAGAAATIYQMLQLGQQYIEVAQPTISRKRTYSYSFSGTLMSTQVVQNLYTTAGLVSAFGIPTGVAAQITADPVATPMENYAYGWKMRKNNLVIIPAKNKIEETIEFEWDQWSVAAYGTPIT